MASHQRILTLNTRLTDNRSEQANFNSARTLLEHQVVLWRPRGLAYTYDQSTDFQGAPCLSDSGTAKFLRDEKRRTKEMQDFLALGRLLVVLTPPPESFYVATGETRNEGTAAKPRVRRIVTERSLSDLIPGNTKLTEASGTSFAVAADTAFRAFWNAVGDQFNYVSIIEGLDSPLLTIKGTNHVVGGLASVGAGRVLFLPERYTFGPSEDFAEQVNGEENEDELWDAEQGRIDKEVDGALLDALFELADSLVEKSSKALPGWSQRFLLPREGEVSKEVDQAESAAESALAAVEQAKLSLLEIREWKRLLTGSGVELERMVETAFERLGCSIEEGPQGRADRVLQWGKRDAVLEIKGLTKSAAERNAAQLEKWVSEHVVDSGSPPKGILVVNAWRSLPLDERTQPAFPDQMLSYSEARGHCLLTTAQLLIAVVTGTSIKKRKEFLKQIFETSGVLPGWDWTDSISVVSDAAD